MTPFDRPLGAADIVGRVLVGLCDLGASYAMGAAFATGASESWVELWRAIGFGTFALISFVLALRPRRSPFLWEAVFLNKAALALAWLLLPDLPEAAESGPVDAGLAAATLIAYGLSQGWRSWLK